jgi:hypothetical protein
MNKNCDAPHHSVLSRILFLSQNSEEVQLHTSMVNFIVVEKRKEEEEKEDKKNKTKKKVVLSRCKLHGNSIIVIFNDKTI